MSLWCWALILGAALSRAEVAWKNVSVSLPEDDEPEAASPSAEQQVEPSPELWAACDELAAGAHLWVDRIVKQWAIELHPVLGLLGKETVGELPSPEDLAGEDAELASSLYRSMRVRVGVSLDVAEVLNFDVQATQERLYDMANQRGGQLTRGILEHISDVSEEYGQVVDGVGREFGDVYIDAVEKIELAFDDEGNPKPPTIVMGLNVAAGVESGLTPTQRVRLQQVLERKREEHRAAQRRPDLR